MILKTKSLCHCRIIIDDMLYHETMGGSRDFISVLRPRYSTTLQLLLLKELCAV